MPQINEVSDIFKWIDTHNHDVTKCWEWLGSLTGRDERGYFTVGGKRRQSHIIVYELFEYPNGKAGQGQVHRHKCDNTHCCNPYHIEPGSRSDNERDKSVRDRVGYTLDMLKEMRRLDKLGMTVEIIVDSINKKFGTDISYGGVYKVLKGDRRSGT